ncbi:MAG TPA: ABC transporter permease [Bryobacteraceae bacterium]|nr:ABC transporter permease [Bryobacteraceae bacterium]
MIGPRQRGRNILIRVWIPVALLACWEILVRSGILNPVLFPPPSKLLAASASMIASGELTTHFRFSLTRLVAGLAIGAGAGLFCGLGMGAWRSAARSLEFIVSALYSTPKLTLLPVVMLLVGVGEQAGIILIAVASFSMMAIHCLDAVRNLNRAYVDLAVNYGADRKAVFFKVYLPGCLPQIFTGFRLATGRALVMTVSVEMIIASNGLGSMIWNAWQNFRPEKLYVAVAVVAGTGALFHYALLWFERTLAPWKAIGERA